MNGNVDALNVDMKFDYIGSYAPIECEECLSEELERTFLGRAYDW